MAVGRHGALCWVLCYAGVASFSGFAAAEAQLPLPDISVDPGVSTEAHDKVKAQKAALEEKLKAMALELEQQREVLEVGKGRVKAIEGKMQETEPRAHKAEQALAEQQSAPRQQTSSEIKSLF